MPDASNSSPLATALDPITHEVVRCALVAVAEQMAATIWRTSYSTVIREMLDYSTALFDPAGRIMAQSCRIPIHLNSMSRALRTTLDERFPLETWAPGDIVLLNDPYRGGQHLPDLMTFLPVYAGDHLLAICGTLGHHLDIGGMRPGSYAGEATEIFQEGLRLPPVKLAEGGRMSRTVLDILEANIRQPDKTLGDLRAQTAALEVGREALLEIVGRYGVPTVRACMAEAMASSERRMRAGLAAMPGGTYRFEWFVDDDGVEPEPIAIRAAVTLGGGEATVDFTGTDRQRRAPINATLSSTESTVYYVILSLVDPTIPANFGCYRPITIIAPEGSVVNAQAPSPVVGRNAITHTIVNVLLGALSQAVPKAVTAAYYGMSNVHVFSGYESDGKRWIFFDIEVGGWGARPTKDGPDCYSMGIHNLANTPIEMAEAIYPLRFHRYEFLPDSGGAGTYRGGLGVRRDIELLAERGTLDTQFDKFKFAPFGLFGGRPGAAGQLVLTSNGAATSLASKTVNYPLKRGDILSMRIQGGGGYADPRRRDRRLIERDLREGKITLEAARREYGYEG